MKKKTALVCGAGGFIGSHLVKRLKKDGFWVRGVDMKYPEFSETAADDFVIGDLRDPRFVDSLFDMKYDRVYQLAADMGGAGFIFTGDNDANIMHNSAMINLNVAEAAAKKKKPGVLFFSSSVCLYPAKNYRADHEVQYSEDHAYPTMPTSEYGWEKIFGERLYMTYVKNYGLNVRIARFHNTYGPEGAWKGGREKAPAAISRKVAEAEHGGHVEVWGDGEQTRPFIYIDDTIDAVELLVKSDFVGPVDISPIEVTTINNLVRMAAEIGGKEVKIKNIPGPTGVRHRRLDHKLIKEKLNWMPKVSLREGMEKTYKWVHEQVQKHRASQKSVKKSKTVKAKSIKKKMVKKGKK